MLSLLLAATIFPSLLPVIVLQSISNVATPKVLPLNFPLGDGQLWVPSTPKAKKHGYGHKFGHGFKYAHGTRHL